MKIDEVSLGQVVYHPASGKRVTIIGIDTRHELILVKDEDKHVKELHVSEVQSIEDWSADDILKREG